MCVCVCVCVCVWTHHDGVCVFERERECVFVCVVGGWVSTHLVSVYGCVCGWMGGKNLFFSDTFSPVIFSITFEEREMCLAAFRVDKVASILAIGGIIPYSSTCVCVE